MPNAPEQEARAGIDGGLGKAYQLFGAPLPSLLDELHEVLAA